MGRQNRAGKPLSYYLSISCGTCVMGILLRRQKYIFRDLTGRHKEPGAAYRI